MFQPCCRVLVLLVFAFIAGAASAQANAAADPRGRWITASGNLEVEIAACGAALCGTVTRVLGNRSMEAGSGEMKAVDERPALGMKLLSEFVASDGEQAWAGQIYNRENGKTYRCRMSLSTAADSAGALVLRAYVGIPLFGKTQLWRRAAVDVSGTSPR